MSWWEGGGGIGIQLFQHTWLIKPVIYDKDTAVYFTNLSVFIDDWDLCPNWIFFKHLQSVNLIFRWYLKFKGFDHKTYNKAWNS